MADMINNPPLVGMLQPLATWFTQVFVICFSIQQSGTTAQRPTTPLWIGRRYYDKTLNKPVYISALSPAVWRDAIGVVV